MRVVAQGHVLAEAATAPGVAFALDNIDFYWVIGFGCHHLEGWLRCPGL
jgi:hypothetical protein